MAAAPAQTAVKRIEGGYADVSTGRISTYAELDSRGGREFIRCDQIDLASKLVPGNDIHPDYEAEVKTARLLSETGSFASCGSGGVICDVPQVRSPRPAGRIYLTV